jgi:hypothetical protein
MLATIVWSLLSFHLLFKNFKFKIYKTTILPAVLYGCETWSLTLREGHRLWVSENRVLRRIFGLRRKEVVGGWRRLHEELHNLCASSNIIRMIKSRMRWEGHVACLGKMRNNAVFWLESLMGRDHVEDMGIDGRIILELILWK